MLIFAGVDVSIDSNKYEISKLSVLRARLKADIPIKELESLTDASTISKQVEIILDQIKHLRAAISTTIENTKNKPRKTTERMYRCKLNGVVSTLISNRPIFASSIRNDSQYGGIQRPTRTSDQAESIAVDETRANSDASFVDQVE